MKRLYTVALFALAALGSFAQRERDLPNNLAPWELPLIREYRETRAGAGRRITTPPAFPVRTMADWQ